LMIRDPFIYINLYNCIPQTTVGDTMDLGLLRVRVVVRVRVVRRHYDVVALQDSIIFRFRKKFTWTFIWGQVASR
jgi:hypothetical protein